LIRSILQSDSGHRPVAGAGNLNALLQQAEQWLEALKRVDMAASLENAEEEVGYLNFCVHLHDLLFVSFPSAV
jgi:hypothetical protein